MFWGKMMLSSNGLSYMDYKVHVELNKAMDASLMDRYEYFIFVLLFYKSILS